MPCKRTTQLPVLGRWQLAVLREHCITKCVPVFKAWASAAGKYSGRGGRRLACDEPAAALSPAVKRQPKLGHTATAPRQLPELKKHNNMSGKALAEAWAKVGRHKGQGWRVRVRRHVHERERCYNQIVAPGSLQAPTTCLPICGAPGCRPSGRASPFSLKRDKYCLCAVSRGAAAALLPPKWRKPCLRQRVDCGCVACRKSCAAPVGPCFLLPPSLRC